MLGRPLQLRISLLVTILPGNIQDAAETAQVEAVQPSFLARVGRPRLAPVEESADDTCVVDAHLCLDGQLAVGPHLVSEPG